jgi:hypothetical protein
MAIRQVSSKKAKSNAEYKKACLRIMDQRENCCQGCGTYERLSFSHLEPRSFSQDHVSNDKMIHIHCMSFGEIEGCHNKYEEHRFSELLDHDEIINKLKYFTPAYYALIQDKIT